MGYRTYHVDESEAMVLRSTTDGYQPKFLVDQGRRFLKVQCELNRTLRDDWRVEDIAGRICAQCGIRAVMQTPCRVKIATPRGILTRMGVVSDNFAVQGYQFLSFVSLLRIDRENQQNFRMLDAPGKLDFMEKMICGVTGLASCEVREYLYGMVLVDLLVLNQDRHLKNFGVFYNIAAGRFEPALLFDFGMGLFENDTIYDSLDTLGECLRYSYIEPFGEDPMELARQLIRLDSFRTFLSEKKPGSVEISRKLFLHPAAYPYFRQMKKLLEV